MRLRHVLGLALTALVACGTDAPLASPSTDASQPTTSAAAASPSPAAAETDSAAPESALFGAGLISTGAEEYRISFTPDGETAYFARGDGFFPQSRDATIYETRLVAGEWTEPVVASFSGEFADIDPWVSPDGNTLYFSSIRPVAGEPRGDADVWRVARVDDGWGEPVHLPELSSEFDELGASVTDAGVVWFASDRPGGAGGWDLYTAEPRPEGAFAAPEPVRALNSPIWEFNPAISADGLTLLFTSINRPGGVGLGDLFEATLADGEWTERPLSVNTSADEYHPSFSPDGAAVYYVRRAGQGDLYVADRP
jgi:Tol biopolymer transport system component